MFPDASIGPLGNKPNGLIPLARVGTVLEQHFVIYPSLKGATRRQ